MLENQYSDAMKIPEKQQYVCWMKKNYSKIKEKSEFTKIFQDYATSLSEEEKQRDLIFHSVTTSMRNDELFAETEKLKALIADLINYHRSSLGNFCPLMHNENKRQWKSIFTAYDNTINSSLNNSNVTIENIKSRFKFYENELRLQSKKDWISGAVQTFGHNSLSNITRMLQTGIDEKCAIEITQLTKSRKPQSINFNNTSSKMAAHNISNPATSDSSYVFKKPSGTPIRMKKSDESKVEGRTQSLKPVVRRNSIHRSPSLTDVPKQLQALKNNPLDQTISPEQFLKPGFLASSTKNDPKISATQKYERPQLQQPPIATVKSPMVSPIKNDQLKETVSGTLHQNIKASQPQVFGTNRSAPLMQIICSSPMNAVDKEIRVVSKSCEPTPFNNCYSELDEFSFSKPLAVPLLTSTKKIPANQLPKEKSNNRSSLEFESDFELKLNMINLNDMVAPLATSTSLEKQLPRKLVDINSDNMTARPFAGNRKGSENDCLSKENLGKALSNELEQIKKILLDCNISKEAYKNIVISTNDIAMDYEISDCLPICYENPWSDNYKLKFWCDSMPALLKGRRVEITTENFTKTNIKMGNEYIAVPRGILKRNDFGETFIVKNQDKHFVLKVINSTQCLEYLLFSCINQRLKPIRNGMLPIYELRWLKITPKESVIIMPYYKYGSLANLSMVMLKNFQVPKIELLVVFICLELLYAVQKIHLDAKVLLCNIKPVKIMLKSKFPLLDDTYEVGSNGFLVLRNFENSILLSSFPNHCGFLVDGSNKGIQCIEMKLKSPWRYQIDFFNLVITLYFLFHNHYPRVLKYANLWTFESFQNIKYLQNVDLWMRLFHDLLNGNFKEYPPVNDYMAELRTVIIKNLKLYNESAEEINNLLLRSR